MRRRDLIVVGGGIAGASLATVMARAGYEVSVLEKTLAFRDENRGELLWPWGVREAQTLGLFDVLGAAGGHVVPWQRNYSDLDPKTPSVGDLTSMIEGVPGSLNLGHPKARQALLDAAEAAGAEVVREARDIEIQPGERPSVRWRAGGAVVAAPCRLIIGADGRQSRVRMQAGIELVKDEPEMYSAGMLVHGEDIPSDANIGVRERDTMLLSFPQRDGYVRLYLCFPVNARHRYDGRDRAERFLADCDLHALPESERWTSSRPAGPCSTFPCSDSWVASPLVDGVALVGDAGGYNNFLIGQGLSLAFRDVAVLSALLLANDAWTPRTLEPYATERGPRLQRARYLARLAGWRTRWFQDAPAERAAAVQLAAEDDLLPTFRGDFLRGYLEDASPPVDALLARLEQLEARMKALAA